MLSIPKRVLDRFHERYKTFVPVLQGALDRDVNEADTVTIVTDLLADLFGYDKYADITKEHAIRSTFCDLAIKIGDKVGLLIEVKAIGLQLKENFITQAVNYGANLGVNFVVLTNGYRWQVYHIVFAQPISNELVMDIDLLKCNLKDEGHLDKLYCLSKEGLTKSALSEWKVSREATSRFMIAAVIMSEPILKAIRKELRQNSPGIGVEVEEIERTLTLDVLKREVVEGDKAIDARKRVQKMMKQREKEKAAESLVKAVPQSVVAVKETPDQTC